MPGSLTVRPAPPADCSFPRELFGYEVLDLIGEGARSVIYAVAHPQTHQILAMKHVVLRREKDERYFEQLVNEFEVSQKFSHRTLRRSLELRDNHTLLRRATEMALVMELFDGPSLDSRPPGSVMSLLHCFTQVAEGLHSLHSLGYAHCDLKPGNILMNADGEVKIIDFGQACRLGTIKQRIQGTADFIAPEQVRREPITRRTDVFNMGATMYWTLTGRSIPTLYTVRKDNNSFLLDDRVQSPHQINPTVPEPLSNLIMECVRSNPLKRPADMAELLRRFEIIRHVVNRRGAAVA
jgi:serine/threonine protein kinase